MPELSARPPFHMLDSDCPCSPVTSAFAIANELSTPVLSLATSGAFAGRRRLSETADNRTEPRRLQGGACPAHATQQGDSCYCDSGYVPDVAGNECEEDSPEAQVLRNVQEIVAILDKPSTGRIVKCFFESLRHWYEPVPFVIRYAGILALVIGSISTYLFLSTFRYKAKRIHELVARHFDVVDGWPKDPDVLAEEDVLLLTGGKRSWMLDFAYLNKLPSFIGLCEYH